MESMRLEWGTAYLPAAETESSKSPSPMAIWRSLQPFESKQESSEGYKDLGVTKKTLQMVPGPAAGR